MFQKMLQGGGGSNEVLFRPLAFQGKSPSLTMNVDWNKYKLAIISLSNVDNNHNMIKALYNDGTVKVINDTWGLANQGYFDVAKTSEGLIVSSRYSFVTPVPMSVYVCEKENQTTITYFVDDESEATQTTKV